MPAYAPAREEDDKKPYVVTVCHWGRESDRLVYADNYSGARYAAIGSGGPGLYVRKTRRAKVEDVEKLDA